MPSDAGPNEVTVLGLHHLQVAMPPGEEQLAREFYAGLLGLTEVPKPPHLAAHGGCWFDAQSLRLQLGVQPDFRPSGKAHPAFLVIGLAVLRRRLEHAGHVIVDDTQLDGHDRLYTFDPFGNRLELIEDGT